MQTGVRHDRFFGKYWWCHKKELITNEEVVGTDAKDLQVGMKIILFLHKKKTDKHPAGYKKIGILTIHSMNDRMIVFKSGSGYIETISVIDLRQGLYRILLEDGTDVRFPPMVDVMKIERARVDHDIEEYRNTIDSYHRRAEERKKNRTSATKTKVKELWDQGKTPDEIVQELNSTPWIVKGMLARMGLLEKVGSHDEKEENANMKRDALKIDRVKAINICLKYGTGVDGQKKIAEEFGVTQKQAEGYIYNHIKREVDQIQKQQKEKKPDPAEKNEQETKAASEINSHEEHRAEMLPPVEDDVKSSITEVAQAVKDSIDTAVNDDVEKISLNTAKEVDEMMELVPNETINHPKHYTAGTIEVIDYLQDKLPPDMFEVFCVGNALKYLSRYRFKGGLDDLKKAQWYIDKIIGAKETA